MRGRVRKSEAVVRDFISVIVCPCALLGAPRLLQATVSVSTFKVYQRRPGRRRRRRRKVYSKLTQ